MFKELYLKSIKLAAHKSSKFFLALISFIESFIFPIPPDVLIIPMTIAKKNDWLIIAIIATIGSVLGACLGYLIGYIFFNEIGIKIFELLCPASEIVLKYKSLNIFSFIILNVLILLFILYEIYYLWANGGTGRRVGLKIQ